MGVPQIATEVLIRHVCHCETATERPHCGDPAEHRFEINGQAFPWYLSERGPVVTQLADDLWRIDIEIIGIAKPVMPNQEPLTIGGTGACHLGEVPVIGGIEFPWVLTVEGWTFTASSRTVPTTTLGFLARNVDTNTPVDDQRAQWADRAIYGNGGDLWKAGKDHCEQCDEWVDGLWSHIEQNHPERWSSAGSAQIR